MGKFFPLPRSRLFGLRGKFQPSEMTATARRKVHARQALSKTPAREPWEGQCGEVEGRLRGGGRRPRRPGAAAFLEVAAPLARWRERHPGSAVRNANKAAVPACLRVSPRSDGPHAAGWVQQLQARTKVGRANDTKFTRVSALEGWGLPGRVTEQLLRRR